MRGRTYLLMSMLFVSIIMLQACNAIAEPTPQAPPVQIDDAIEQTEQLSLLRDTAWTVVSYGGADPIPVVPNSYPTVNYLTQRYSGYTGCNFYLGTYGVEGDELRMDTPAVTNGFCDEEALLRQEETFLGMLENAMYYEISDGNLLLHSSDTQMLTLEPMESVPLEGTVWNFEFLATGPLLWMPVLTGTAITAQFDGDRIAGNAGCNDYTGVVVREDNQMRIRDLVATRMVCAEPEGIMDQEQRYLERLVATGRIAQYARTFELFDSENQPLMLFAAETE